MNTENLPKLQSTAKYLAFCAVAIGLFLISYNFFSKNTYKGYDKFLVSNISKIQEINDECRYFNTSDSIDKNKALKKIPSISYDLSNIKNTLSEKPPADLNDNYNNLLKGLENNILIIQQAEAMLNNPTGKDIEQASKNLVSYKDTANNYYSLISIKNINFSTGSNLNQTVENTINYCLTSNNLKKGVEIKVEQYNGLVAKIEELNKTFQDNKVDYYPEAMKARKGIISYELIISNIDRGILILENLKSSLNEIIVPNDGLSIYRKFKGVLDTYDNYLKNIKYSIATESVHNSKGNAKEDFLDSLYITSKELFSEVEVNHKEFLIQYDKFKKSK